MTKNLSSCICIYGIVYGYAYGVWFGIHWKNTIGSMSAQTIPTSFQAIRHLNLNSQGKKKDKAKITKFPNMQNHLSTLYF